MIGIAEKLKRTTKISIRIGRLHLLVAYLGDGGLEPVGWFRVHHPLRPTRYRLWLDGGLKKEQITTRPESSLMLMHFSLGLGSGVSQSDLQFGWRADFEERYEAAFAKFTVLDRVMLIRYLISTASERTLATLKLRPRRLGRPHLREFRDSYRDSVTARVSAQEITLVEPIRRTDV